jgi:hypothetical protein
MKRFSLGGFLMRLPKIATLTIPLTLVCTVAAADGIQLTERSISGGTTSTHQIQIDQNHMRAETGGQRQQTVIFDNAKQVLWMVNNDAKTYTEMTKADVDRLSGQMSAMMATMQEQMKNLPPEQRARIEEMMKGRGMGGGAAASKTEYKKVGTDKAGKWNCDKYEGTRNGQKVIELCTVEPAALGFTMADFAVARELGDFFKGLAPQNADRLFSVGTEGQGFSGVPVRRVTFSNGQPEMVHEIVDVTRQTFPASTFEVPAGFQKQPFMGGRGRQ